MRDLFATQFFMKELMRIRNYNDQSLDVYTGIYSGVYIGVYTGGNSKEIIYTSVITLCLIN